MAKTPSSVCTICGEPRAPGKGRRCAKHRYVSNCKGCGKRHYRRAWYCSPECHPTRLGQCLQCGNAFAWHLASGDVPKWCSPECKRAAQRRIPAPQPCDSCSQPTLNRRYLQQRLCPTCRGEVRAAASRRKGYARRQILSRESDVTIAHELTLRRKARHCPMPGCAVRLTGIPFQPNSKELDHIVPLGCGGTHTVGNVRIICRGCNLSRPKDGRDYAGQLSLWCRVEPQGHLGGEHARSHSEIGRTKAAQLA